ncbi:hypothetical protein SG34_004375 [Thalassomonas viridans]|uniref:Uncharacterized protein n=1 Tax=Thalassomonas viridans TaxID=137584 RepID=A0AAE9Z514_9GAMM|nr:hypothetical protein [Thalassomonas viridans]WDE06174.1 hypothetical protein SG34_004375 [Thalassomonas viridans]
MNMLQVKTCFKKEMWEFKKIFLYLPLLITALVLAALAGQYLLLEDYQLNGISNAFQQMQQVPAPPEFDEVFFGMLTALFMPFVFTAAIIQVYYFITCFFDERRDLSIYFWRSLPVADSLTVAVKLITGALLIPAIFMLAASLTMALLLLMGALASLVLSVGYDISLWHLWASADIFANLGAVWLSLLPYTLWLLPVYAWLMLASIIANKAPFLWAVLPLVILVLVEALIVKYFGLTSAFFAQLLVDYLSLSAGLLEQYLQQGDSFKQASSKILFTKIDIGASLFAAGLLYLTWWFRVNRGHH